MAVEIGESILENILGLDNDTESQSDLTTFPDCDGFSTGDEFMHEQWEYGISELSGCKRILYATVGSSNERVWDVFFLFPSLIFFVFLCYSWPRTRQQLAGSPTLHTSLHLLLLVTPGVSLLRTLLLLAFPTPLYSAGALDKVTWTITRAISLFLELCALLILFLTLPPSPRTSRRLLAILSLSSSFWAIFTLVLELTDPAKEFHVFSKCTSLYGEGGGLYISLTSLLLSSLYSSLLVLHMFRRKSRVSVLIYLSLLLLTSGLRTMGGLMLYHDLPLGLCLTNLTLFLLVAGLPPLVWRSLLHPLLVGGGPHSMGGGLAQYVVQVDTDWVEEEEDINSGDASCQDEIDDYQL